MSNLDSEFERMVSVIHKKIQTNTSVQDHDLTTLRDLIVEEIYKRQENWDDSGCYGDNWDNSSC